MAKHKCFISYHHDDQYEVDEFIKKFANEKDVFTAKGLGQKMADEIIKSTDTDYVMKRIRELYLSDSTVTIVLLGECTWARKYVDWEIQASLRNGDKTIPNGLLAIKLPCFPKDSKFPKRLDLNLDDENPIISYADLIEYPSRKDTLEKAIEKAFNKRSTDTAFINNPRERFLKNRSCE